jgi:excisionase family DNA binding protein
VKDAAVRLNLSSKKVYRMCLAGELRCFRAGRAIRISLDEIERFEQSGAAPVDRRVPVLMKRHY